MSLSIEPDVVIREIRANTKARDTHMQGIDLLLEKYPGDWWANGGVFGDAAVVDGENAGFEYVAYTMAQYVWENPRWNVTTRRPRAQQLVAESMSWFQNRWSQDSNLKPTLEDLAVDFMFGWCVAHVSPQPLPGNYEAEDPKLWPQLSRISMHDFGMDHQCRTPRQARIQWHRWRIDKDDLVEMAKKDRAKARKSRERWDLGAIQDMDTVSASEIFAQSVGRRNRGVSFAAGLDGPDRKQIEVYSVYFPGHQLPGSPGPEHGFNGTILTLGVRGSDDTSPVMLKPPMPFFGPRWGPYTVGGAYIVPDSPWPLSLLAGTAAVGEQASRLSMAVDAQVAAYKRLGITSDHVLAKLIKDGRNDNVYTVLSPNVEALFREWEVGGTTAPNIAAEQRVIAKRDRAMGFSENQRGVTTGDTATDVTYANESANARVAYPRARYQDAIRRAGTTVAWYGYHTDEIELPLPPEALEQLGVPEGFEAFFQGGTFDEGSGTTFDDLGLEIDAYSMQRPSEQTRAQNAEVILAVMQMAPSFPVIAQMGGDVKGLLDAFGEHKGMPKLSKYFPQMDSVDLASMQPDEVAPRLGRDVGLAGMLQGLKARGQAGGGFKLAGGAGRSGPKPSDFAAG